MTPARFLPVRSLPARKAAALGAAALTAAVLASGCTIPITAQTITGGALNAGALLFVDRHNEGSGEGSYAYHVRAGRDTLAAIFEAAVERANREHLFPPSTPRSPSAPAPRARRPSADREADGVILARAPGRAWRPDDPPTPEAFSERQWTPEPLFGTREGSPEARGDTLLWVVTHRAGRQVAFRLASEAGSAVTRVALVPHEPPADVLTSVPTDHAQRNAVEALHQVFYLAVREHLGPAAFAGARERGRERRGEP